MRLALALVVLAARAASAAVTATPEVAVVIAPATGSATLANDADTAVTVDTIAADNTCDPAVVATPLGPFTIAAHGSQAIALSCLAHATGIARCVFHARDAASQPLADFEAACLYAPDTTLDASAASITFPGTVSVGATATQTISLTNHGTAGQTVGKLSFQLTDLAGNFAIGSPCNPDARDCTAGIAGVPIGGSIAVEIECTPHTPGLHTAKLYIATDSGQRLGTPIALVCTGATDPVNPVFLATPTPVELGGIDVLGGEGSGVVALSNVGGNGTLVIRNLRVLDAGNGAASDWTFAAGGPCSGVPCNLAPGQTMRVTLGFDPSALGVRDATLVVSYTDTALRDRSISLHGTGLGGTLQLIGPALIDLGTLPIGVAQAVTVQLANSGNETLDGVMLSGDGGAFSISPKLLSLAHAVPATVTITCQPTAAGLVTAVLQASATKAVSGSPIAISVVCRGTTSPLFAIPSTIQLGEIRVGQTPLDHVIQIMGATIDDVHLGLDTPNLMLVVPHLPAPSPLDVTLQAIGQTEGTLPAIVVEPSSGDALEIPVNGAVVTASYSAPPVAALGTYCIGQPTTATTLALTSTGTATISLAQPALVAGGASPFELALISPTLYPELLAPGLTATVAIIPDRQTVPGPQLDQLTWTTDVTGMPTATTKISAAFVDSGGAIAPAALAFGKQPIHTGSSSQRLTIQNCNNSDSLRLDAPSIELPFTLDTPSDFPRTLAPNETMSFSVSFAPLTTRVFSSQLTITADTLPAPLSVELSGEGIVDTVPPDAGVAPAKPDSGCCGAGGSASAWPLVLLFVLRRRRRRC